MESSFPTQATRESVERYLKLLQKNEIAHNFASNFRRLMINSNLMCSFTNPMLRTSESWTSQIITPFPLWISSLFKISFFLFKIKVSLKNPSDHQVLYYFYSLRQNVGFLSRGLSILRMNFPMVSSKLKYKICKYEISHLLGPLHSFLFYDFFRNLLLLIVLVHSIYLSPSLKRKFMDCRTLFLNKPSS